MKYFVLLGSALFFVVANLSAEPLISADDKKQTNESKTSQSAKKTSSKNASSTKAFSILLDAGKNKVADDTKQKKSAQNQTLRFTNRYLIRPENNLNAHVSTPVS